MIYAVNEILADVALYCSKELDIRKDLDIIITECCLEHDKALGWTYDEVEGEIDIELDKSQSVEEKILTLCHEMVHVKQFSEGDDSNEEEAYNLEGGLRDGFILQAANW
jgi:hypothetical protein